ncbi:MAG: hypothetical protein KGY53_08740, partial [Wenzhouxiangellaceae bacterium]|nr:hypothetical protein [Wenzhouxiangellaceae bacterium]
MHDCQRSRSASLCGVVFAGLMLIGLLVPNVHASPGEARIEARSSEGTVTVGDQAIDRRAAMGERNDQDRSGLRGPQQSDGLLEENPELIRFFEKMPPEVFAEFGTPEAAAALPESVESLRQQRPAP